MRIVSGIQPTGDLHLGNWLGAIRQWVRLQDEAEVAGGEALYFLADLHAITVALDPAQLAANTREMAAALIACGIDPARAILFNQARVPAHAELAWLLFCTARVGLAQSHDPVQGQGRPRPGGRVGGLVRLPRAAGGRRAALQCHPRAGGRGSEAASGAGPRHRGEVQHRPGR